MTEHLPQQSDPRPGPVGEWGPRPGVDYWRDESGDEGSGISLGRMVGALLRQKWIILAAAAIGAGAGYLAYHSVELTYQTQGELWINTQNAMGELGGPISQGQLLEASAWDDLIRSSRVLDAVVIDERLYVVPSSGTADALEGMTMSEQGVAPGQYRLEVSDDGQRWRLILRRDGRNVSDLESGRVGESLTGTDQHGMVWTPPPPELTPGRKIDFQILSPREASLKLGQQIDISIHGDGNFISLALAGTDPERIARILTAVMRRHEQVAADLKRAKLDELTDILRTQLDTVQAKLDGAESALLNFQIETVTLPTEQSAPVAAGLQQTQGPVMSDFFSQRIALDALEQDIERLETQLGALARGEPLSIESFHMIGSVASSTEFRRVLDELVNARAEERALLRDYTEAYQPVRDLRGQIDSLEQRIIPAMGRSLHADLTAQADNLRENLDDRATELEEIPSRSIQEQGLQRQVRIADQIYTTLESHYQRADLAAAQSVPDVRILSEPQVPQTPTRDERVRLAGMAFLGVLGAGLLGVILMDRFDPRIRDPLEVQDDIGLEILGAIPRIRLAGRANTGEVTEAFREIRMRLEFAYGSTKPLIVAVTSPDTGEGKTLVSANLAIAFSQLSHRTLLIDADTRRGDIHELLEVDRKPGLTDLLRGHANGDAMVSTAHQNLWFIGSGSRISSSPELLSGARMQELMAQVKQRFDVVIIDSPPLAAGGDAFVLGAHAGAVLVVMRSGSTHRELAKAKMEAFYRLPVRILGAVLNDIEETSGYGSYRYYSYYLPGYRAETEEEEDAGRSPTEPVAG